MPVSHTGELHSWSDHWVDDKQFKDTQNYKYRSRIVSATLATVIGSAVERNVTVQSKRVIG